MNYIVAFSPFAERGFRRLNPQTQTRLAPVINALAGNPRPAGCIRLTDRPHWRVRVGDYRVVYSINDTARSVMILDVIHRSDAYR